jgi:hypothetical protein
VGWVGPSSARVRVRGGVANWEFWGGLVTTGGGCNTKREVRATQDQVGGCTEHRGGRWAHGQHAGRW